jgi:hypothetical protein
MRKAALIVATAGSLALSVVVAPAPAEARGGFGPGIAGGLIAGAIIGGLASNAYGYGPGYGYYGGYGPPVLWRICTRVLRRLCAGLLRWICILRWLWIQLSAGVSTSLCLWWAALLWRLAPRLASPLVSRSEQPRASLVIY